MTDHARAALELLRDSSQFKWYVIPFLLVVIYVYATEVERRNWNVFFAGLALWGMDWFNEIWNSLVFHATGRAPVWGATGPTAYQILIGLNIEICFMFAIMGVAAAKMLPPRETRILGLPNRPILIALNSAAAVGVEVLLNKAGVLTWDWSWWRPGFPYLIWLIGYVPFFVACFRVYDLATVRAKALAVGAILGVDALALIIFGTLGWL
ncbi:hypothetical protein [Nocardia seriolae]|uniref:Lycopene cyclase domain-containing protein n=1 Tax=Nocardia seriolae TaxID=37332 RepID=A0A0B8NHK1_9NOCA|nr:hypothetical protein [Nocardia seriolae]APA95430.1 uncharacterized protein NS506_01358 [Nocardia seriolae]MTJ66426.1 hypothetical protein [Nocardia seriolae]MTJ75890.1 hypothetical protein [Nocardia seriolae]MTJ85671.1 hypothetical protein [Nocardia seriolae]MTK29668.1 hypothetical protein [Nocardia seriolae]